MASIEEAKQVLKQLGLPPAQQNEISALTLLVLAGLKPSSPWKSASRVVLRIHDLMLVMKSQWKKRYAENTRETVRRQVLHQFEQARVVDRNPEDPTLATNSPRTHYALTSQSLSTLRSFGTRRFARDAKEFQREHGTLLDKYRKERDVQLVPVTLPNGAKLLLSAGKHNDLQRKVIEEFLPRFGPEASLIYLGDTAKKNAFVDQVALKDLRLTITDHGKLPDILLWDRKRNWLFLIEAVTSHGPVSPKREEELRKLFAPTRCGLVFVTAFPDVAEFRRHAANVAWETEVWIAEHAGHLIHFNGDRFLGPR